MHLLEFLVFIVYLTALVFLFFRNKKEKRNQIYGEDDNNSSQIPKKKVKQQFSPYKRPKLILKKIQPKEEKLQEVAQFKAPPKGLKFIKELNSPRDMLVISEVFGRAKGWD